MVTSVSPYKVAQKLESMEVPLKVWGRLRRACRPLTRGIQLCQAFAHLIRWEV